MQNGIQKAVQEILTNPNTLVSDEPHHCEVCGRYVPPLEVEILGVKRMVQPKCKCEADKHTGFVKDAKEYEIKRQIEQKFSINNLGERFASCTFEAFQSRPGTAKAFSNAKTYAESFENVDSDGLLIWGIPGNGKSHIAAAIAHAVKAKEKTVVFQTVPELLERIRSTFNAKQKDTEKSIMEALLHCDLLVLDDIGSEKISDWVLDVMFRIVDGRYRQKKPIVYTTNLNPKELKFQLNDRIYDRMIETSTIIENSGTSYRREIAEKRYKRLEGEDHDK